MAARLTTTSNHSTIHRQRWWWWCWAFHLIRDHFVSIQVHLEHRRVRLVHKCCQLTPNLMYWNTVFQSDVNHHFLTPPVNKKLKCLFCSCQKEERGGNLILDLAGYWGWLQAIKVIIMRPLITFQYLAIHSRMVICWTQHYADDFVDPSCCVMHAELPWTNTSLSMTCWFQIFFHCCHCLSVISIEYCNWVYRVIGPIFFTAQEKPSCLFAK